jgi:hypothetical protein
MTAGNRGAAMGFVVRATLNEENPIWLSTRWPDGSRSFVCLQEIAATFSTADVARAAIADLPEAVSKPMFPRFPTRIFRGF